METKSNPDVVATETAESNSIEEGTIKPKSDHLNNAPIDKIQQVLKDMGLEDADLEKVLQAGKELKAQASPTVMETVKDNAVAQVKQFGASTVASLIAILIAVIIPVILNSQFAQDVSETIADIRKKLPNEADELLMNQVTELSKNNQFLISQISTEQKLLQAKNAELSKGEQSFKQEYLQITQKLAELENQNKDLTASLSKKVAELENRSVSTNVKPNYALLKQLSKLTSEGEKLTSTQLEKSERWFKRTFYTVQGLQKEPTNQQLSTYVLVLKSIVEKDGEFREFSKRKEEALIVLDVLSSLVDAAIIR